MTDDMKPSEDKPDDPDNDLHHTHEEVDPPPFFNSWNGMYALVIGVFVGLVVLFYVFTKFYE